MRSLVAQYLQLVDPSALPIPENVSNQAIQESIFEHMFNGSFLPPPSYQTRVLKRILTRIEETSGPDDVRTIPPGLHTSKYNLLIRPGNHRTPPKRLHGPPQPPKTRSHSTSSGTGLCQLYCPRTGQITRRFILRRTQTQNYPHKRIKIPPLIIRNYRPSNMGSNSSSRDIPLLHHLPERRKRR